VFADTNWSNSYFSFVINPCTLNLEIWRTDKTGVHGFPWKGIKKKAPEFAKWLDENIDEGLMVFQFPKDHWSKIRTLNGIERVNREIKQRTQVARPFDW
jgi:hypothetical protein